MSASPVRRRRADSIAAEAAFRARIAELGGRVVGEYTRFSAPVACICPDGHECAPRPNNIAAGKGMCVRHRPSDSIAAEAAFRARLVELGATLLEPQWLGTGEPHHVRCAAGHDCHPRPNGVLRGGGVCLACGWAVGPKARSDRAWQTFQANLAAQGATLMETEWLGATVPHHVRCKFGHDCYPMPHNVRRRGTCCSVCAERDPGAAGAAFAERVAEQGARLLGTYKNAYTPVSIECSAGHRTTVMPSNVQRGAGLCRHCSHKVWDAFYVVVNPTLRRVKFGVTSGNPRRRLADHRTAGYTDVVHVRRDMPDAPQLERHILATLRDADIPAVHGWEYFDASALAVVLDVVDGWTSGTTPA